MPGTAPAPYGTWNSGDWLNLANQNWRGYSDWLGRTNQTPKVSNLLASTGYRPLEGLLNLGGQLSNLGYSNLGQILASQGKTDPRVMQGMERGIARDTAGLQQALSGTLAQRGVGNSGVGLALQQAVGQGGANRLSDLRANEAQLAEQRKRDDLASLFQGLVLQPGFDSAALHLGQYNADRQNSQNRQGATLGALGALLGLFG